MMKTLAELRTEIELGFRVFSQDPKEPTMYGVYSCVKDDDGRRWLLPYKDVYWLSGPCEDRNYASFEEMCQHVWRSDKPVWSTLAPIVQDEMCFEWEEEANWLG